MSIMRTKISDGVLDRLRKYVATKDYSFPHDRSASLNLSTAKGKVPFYGLTIDEAIDLLLKEVGF